MKLYNKKTGEIIIPTDYTFATYDDGIKYGHRIYYSLAELNEDWEDYNPAEPLIKDEKIRKAVRAWAEANELSDKLRVINEHFDSCKILGRCDSRNVCLQTEFKTTIAYKHQYYTIAELCGEEEAPEPLEPSFIDLDERIREKEGE